MVEMYGEQDESYQYWNDDDGGGRRRREGVVPELDPAEDGHLDQEQKETLKERC